MKKFAIVFLSLCLVVSLPFAAHANIVTSTGRYLINAIKHAPGGAKVTATNSVTGAKHVINHGVSSADLGKGIGAGVVTLAIGSGVGFAFQAITGLALDGVQWLMDEENNAVKYTVAGVGWKEVSNPRRTASTAEALCMIIHPADYNRYKFIGVQADTATRFQCLYSNIYSTSPAQHAIDKISGPLEQKSIPLDALAQKTIELAEAGNTAAQKDVEDFVTNLAQSGDLDNELDNAPDITQPENPEEPNPEEPQECPSGTVEVDDACVKIPDSGGDEPLFCDSSEFTKKVCDWIDWTQTEQDELEPDAGKVDIIDKSDDLSIDNDRIDFSNQCPAPTPINTSVGGFPVSTELNYQPLCDFFTMLNPFVVGMGGISSALIIAGGARRG